MVYLLDMYRHCTKEDLSYFLRNENISFHDISKLQMSQLTQSTINLLDEICHVSHGFSYVITLESFRQLLKENFSFETQENSFFNVCYQLQKVNLSAFKQLHNNYNVILNGAVSFYKVNLEQYENDLNLMLDLIKKNIDLLTSKFKLKCGKDIIILPYYYNNNDYFIIHYGYERNNIELEKSLISGKKIKTAGSFYFFFWKEKTSEKIFLVIKNQTQNSNIKYLIDSLNEIFPQSFFYDELSLVNFGDIEHKFSIQDPSARISEIHSVILHTANYSSLIMIKGPNAIKDAKEITNENILIRGIELNYAKYDAAKRVTTLRGLITDKCVKLTTNQSKIQYFINLLKSSNIINTEGEYERNIDEFIKEYLFNGQLLSRNGENLEVVRKYIKKQTPLSRGKVEGYEDLKLEQENKEEQVIDINLGEILKKEKKLPQFDSYSFSDNIGVIQFKSIGRAKFKDVTLLFSKKIDHIIAYVVKNSGKTTKYLAFVDKQIDEDIIAKITKLQLNCLIFGLTDLSKFLEHGETFIQENQKNIIVGGNSPVKILADDLDMRVLAKSGQGDVFEDSIESIFMQLFYRFIKFGSQYRGLSIPDGIIIGDTEVILYDSKSSTDILSYLGSSEARKFHDYMGFFPDDPNIRKYFLIIGPDLDAHSIKLLSERDKFKNMISEGKNLIYLGGSILQFLYHLLKYQNFLLVQPFINRKKFSQLITHRHTSGSISNIQLEEFRKRFKNYFIDVPSHAKEVAQKLEDGTNAKIDIIQEIQNFQTYIDDFNI